MGIKRVSGATRRALSAGEDPDVASTPAAGHASPNTGAAAPLRNAIKRSPGGGPADDEIHGHQHQGTTE